MKKISLSALAAAGLLAGGLATGANAADLGGNCCADLEERVAELEATTARKGNRKVSLTVSGWVTENVVWWDDGHESNTYVVGSGTTLASNVKFSGQATIVPGWTAGYLIHLELDGSDSLITSQNTPTGPGLFAGSVDFAQTVQSYWFVKSEHYGKVSVGLVSQASDNTAILVDGSGSLVPANYVPFEYNSFLLRNNGTGALGATAIGGTFRHPDANGAPLNGVRYDSPTFAGFSVSAGWGQDDFWDVAARYSGEHAGFKLAFAAAYAESTDSSGLPNLLAANDEHFQVGGYIQHVATGLFLYGAYGNVQNDVLDTDADTYYVKAGIRGKWNPLGATVLFGEYEDGEQTAAGVNNGNFQLWGLGAVQEIDNAAMSIWLTYRNIEADNGVAGAAGESIDFDQVKFGALINF